MGMPIHLYDDAHLPPGPGDGLAHPPLAVRRPPLLRAVAFEVQRLFHQKPAQSQSTQLALVSALADELYRKATQRNEHRNQQRHCHRDLDDRKSGLYLRRKAWRYVMAMLHRAGSSGKRAWAYPSQAINIQLRCGAKPQGGTVGNGAAHNIDRGITQPIDVMRTWGNGAGVVEIGLVCNQRAVQRAMQLSLVPVVNGPPVQAPGYQLRPGRPVQRVRDQWPSGAMCRPQQKHL